MKKILFLIGITSIMFAGCMNSPQNVNTNIQTQPKQTQNQDNQENVDQLPDKSVICGWVCYNIQKICKEDIENWTTVGQDLETWVLEEASCQLLCEASWDEKTIGCVSDADNCAQISDSEPYCIDDEKEEVEAATPPDSKLENNCVNACNNYVNCVAYWDDVTQEDKDNAFDSCMQMCPSWTENARKCVVNTTINNANDCGTQTRCILWF